MKILVIDDSNSARYLAVKTLHDVGYKQTVDVASAEEAMTRMKVEKFDCILLDWHLGGMSGFDFLKKLRSSKEHEKIAVIMMTTVNEKSSVLQALKVGLQGYFFKPISGATLGPKMKEIEMKLIPAVVAAAGPGDQKVQSEEAGSNDKKTSDTSQAQPEQSATQPSPASAGTA